eukprot:3420005-Pleurochrysis_carterae.AAC.1
MCIRDRRTLIKSLLPMVDADVASAVLGAEKHDALAFARVAMGASGQQHKTEAQHRLARAQADILLVDVRCGVSAVMAEQLLESGFGGIVGVIGDEVDDFYGLAQLPRVVWLGRGEDKSEMAQVASRVLVALDEFRQELTPTPSAHMVRAAAHAPCEEP